MKTEKTHYTVDEIQKQTHELMDEDVALQTFDREPLTSILEMLDSISITALYSSPALISFLQKGGIPGHAARPSDGNNGKLFHTFDLWIDHYASTKLEIAAALVAQVPHMIARAWKRRDPAQDSILKLESAMYQFTALQRETDSQGAAEDRLKLGLLEKYMDRAPIELAQFDGWDIGPEQNGHMTPDEDGHWTCGSTTHELRRSPDDLRVRIFIPIDTDPKTALVLTRKLAHWIEKIADSGMSFREEFDWRPKIRKPREKFSQQFDDAPF